MKKLIRIALFAIIAFTVSPVIAEAENMNAINESVIIVTNGTGVNSGDMMVQDENGGLTPLKKHPLKNKIMKMKEDARRGDVLIISADALLLIVIILLLIVIL